MLLCARKKIFQSCAFNIFMYNKPKAFFFQCPNTIIYQLLIYQIIYQIYQVINGFAPELCLSITNCSSLSKDQALDEKGICAKNKNISLDRQGAR